MLIVMITLEPRVAAMRMAPPAARMRRVFLLAGNRAIRPRLESVGWGGQSLAAPSRCDWRSARRCISVRNVSMPA